MVQNEVKLLGNICEIGRGSSPRPINDMRYFEAGTIPWIKIADATKSEKYLYETKEHVNEYGASFSRIMPKGSLIFSASGVSLGKPIILGVEGCIHDGWIYLNNFDKTILSEYLYYFLLTQQKYFLNFSYGAAIQNINTDIMKGMPISLPSTKNQQKIVNILSNYDDLIENNNKRIKILEKMAQKIYKEWFVDFKFPNHENATFKQTDLGNEVMPKKGKNITKATIKEGNVPVVAGGIEPAYYHNVPNTVAPVITVSASGANAGYINLYYQDIWASDCSYIDTTMTPYVYYYYLLLKHNQIKVTNMQRGAAQPHVYPQDLAQLKFDVPDENVIKMFNGLITPIFEQIANLTLKNTNLKQTRDLLLPRLISGEIDVENLEII